MKTDFPIHPRAALDVFRRKAMMRSLRASHFDSLQPHVPGEPGVEIIVSLTSFGDRLSTVDVAIRSILAGSVKPNRIILWLDDETNSGPLPTRLIELQHFGVEIRRGCQNIRGHKKYYWAMKENPRSIVITIDDDAMYPIDTVSSLLTTHDKYPKSVVGRRVHRILTDTDGHVLPYNKWDQSWHIDDTPRMDLLPTGVGAVLYPPSCLGEQAFDLRAITDSAMNADDIWLKVNELICGTPASWAACEQTIPWLIPDTQETSLKKTNVYDGGNDSALASILSHFAMSQSDFANLVESGGDRR